MIVSLFLLGKPVPKIPTGACAVQYGNFMELVLAELACASDLNCKSLVDDGCDRHGPFHICSELEHTTGENMQRCTAHQEKGGKNVFSCF